MIIPEDVILPQPLWAELVKWRAGYCCEECGKDRDDLVRDGFSQRLHAHHVNHDASDSRLDNGSCLCTSCHGKKHIGGVKRKCDPGCKCGKHYPKRLPDDVGPRCGHDDWVRYKNGNIICRVCKKEYQKRYDLKLKSRLSKW